MVVVRDIFGLDATRHQKTGTVDRCVDENPLIGLNGAYAVARQLRGIDAYAGHRETFGAWPILNQALN